MRKTKAGIAALTLGALGVVFGDIGTSPLYAVRAVFGVGGQHLAITQQNVYGIISLIIWSVTLVVSIKYIGFIMRADNQGEGGAIALVGRIKDSALKRNLKWLFIGLGLLGMALFYGDSVVTPAISVLSAVEGLKVITPHFGNLVIPITLLILTLLFALQRYGTGLIGRLFGPVMLIWFAVIAAGGLWQIWHYPDILQSLSPLAAARFINASPWVAFIAMGAVILAVTGAEALYADMGHFGRKPIARAWFLFVFPALILCYMGQGALLLHNSYAVSNPFILLFPESVRVLVLILATLAAFIASQSVISGAFSLTRQAVQFNFLPRMLVRHTSDREAGQIYLPFVNAALFAGVIALVLLFGSSVKLANAYGVAVSGTLAIDAILFMVFMRTVWRKPLASVLLFGVVFLTIDFIFVAANLSKIMRGGWVTLSIAALVFLLLQTWVKGRSIASRERRSLEGPLQDYIDKIHTMKPSVVRVPGTAVYIGHHEGLAPLALHASVEELHELHERVIIVQINITNYAHVPPEERAVFNSLGYNDGIGSLTLFFGYHDAVNIPQTLKSLRNLSPELNFDPQDVSYFVSQSKIVPTKRRNMWGWRKDLYAIMYRNAASASDYYRLPVDRTIDIQSLIKL